MQDTSPDHISDEIPVHALPTSAIGWLALFGPGAIIASLTIGTGELIFSTRGGSLFGYPILFLFVIISVLKWGLVLASSRHFVLTGVHPYERMFDLPGPRGWFPLVLFLIAAVCMPIWVSFHSTVLGNLTAWITGTSGRLGGGIDYAWAVAILTTVLILAGTGGYSRLERVQLVIVALLMLCAGITLVLYNPDWIELLTGAVIPSVYEYPTWLGEAYPEIAAQPVWVETTRYVGVIGGAGFDYMVYTSFLRDKAWGAAGAGPISETELQAVAADPQHPVRKWVRAPYVDCTISFVVIVAFSAVFVASGAMILGPNHKVPDEGNLLNLQAEFVTNIDSWLLPLYVAGAVLTMLGTLYGTLEVACAIASELIRSASHQFGERHAKRIRRFTIAWCATIAFAILAWLLTYQLTGGQGRPRLLLAILTPANLFTGVLGCGLFCMLNLWMDHKHLPRALRMPWPLAILNLVSGIVFLALGVKGYWDDQSRVYAIGSLLCLFVIGFLGAALAGRFLTPSHDLES